MSGGELVTCTEFRCRYPPRPPNDVDYHEPHEWILLQDLSLLPRAPAAGVMIGGSPPRYRNGRTTFLYLWVIDLSGIPYILEYALPELGGNPPKHTNLTGGNPASTGGELWFHTESSLFLSGKSGRYGPRDEQQLADAVTVFEDYGYDVLSLGWEDGQPRAYLP